MCPLHICGLALITMKNKFIDCNFWLKLFIGASLLVSNKPYASSLFIQLTDRQGHAFEGAVAYVIPKFEGIFPQNIAKESEVVQKDKQFLPKILVVQKGAEVFFPNLDDIQHHVYSFSPAHPFEKKLYKGRDTQAELFDKEGSVELGCNIHDWMLGYVKVVDTPYFGLTDEKGQLQLNDLPEGHYRLIIWHPRILNAYQGMQETVEIHGDLFFEYQLQDKVDDYLGGYDDFEQEDDYQ